MGKNKLLSQFNKLKIDVGYRGYQYIISCTACTYCTDCTDCTYCTYCTDCTDCTYCTYCRNCRNCILCVGMTNINDGFWLLNKKVTETEYNLALKTLKED